MIKINIITFSELAIFCLNFTMDKTITCDDCQREYASEKTYLRHKDLKRCKMKRKMEDSAVLHLTKITFSEDFENTILELDSCSYMK